MRKKENVSITKGYGYHLIEKKGLTSLLMTERSNVGYEVK